MSRALNNNSGFTVILALATVALMGLFAASVAQVSASKVQQSKHTNIGSVADDIRQNLTNLVSSPWAWEKTKEASPSAFNALSGGAGTYAALPYIPESIRKVKLFNVDNHGQLSLYYDSSNASSGFTPQGKPCDPQTDGDFVDSKTAGNPKCPFHYDVTLQSRTLRPGTTEYIEVVRFKLKFRPGPTSTWVFNDEDARYNFDLTRNFSSTSVETTCFLLNGVYNESEARCSIRLTQDTTCPSNTVFAGPRSADSLAVSQGTPTTSITSTPCQNLALSSTCPTGYVMIGFTSAGEPKCGPVQ